MEILKNPNLDFLGKTRYFIGMSLVLITAGLAYMWTQGVRYGVEFSGGTQVIVQFTTTPAVDHVRSAVDKVASGIVIQSYGDPTAMTTLLVNTGFLPHELAWGDGKPSRIASLPDYTGEIIWSRRDLTQELV